MQDSHDSGSKRDGAGLKLSPIIFACIVSLSITVPATVILLHLGLPWWVWISQFVVLGAVSFGIVQARWSHNPGEARTPPSVKELVFFVLFVALLIVGMVVAMLYL